MSINTIKTPKPYLIGIKSNFSISKSQSPTNRYRQDLHVHAPYKVQSQQQQQQQQLISSSAKLLFLDMDTQQQKKDCILPNLNKPQQKIKDMRMNQQERQQQYPTAIKSDINIKERSSISAQKNKDQKQNASLNIGNIKKINLNDVNNIDDCISPISSLQSPGNRINSKDLHIHKITSGQKISLIDSQQQIIEQQLEKEFIIFRKLKNLSLDKRKNKSFFTLILRIIDLLIQSDKDKTMNDIDKIKHEIFDSIKSLFLCKNEELYQAIDLTPSEFNQLSYIQISQKLFQKLQLSQEENSKNNENNLVEKQEEKAELKKEEQNKALEEDKKIIEETSQENEEILKMKRIMQKLSIQKNDLNKEMSEMTMRLKDQENNIEQLKSDLIKQQKIITDEHLKDKMKLKQEFYILEDKYNQLKQSSEELHNSIPELQQFAYDVLKIIKNLNQSIQYYEMEFIYKQKLSTVGNKEKFELINETKQLNPQIKQIVRKILNLHIV